MNAYLATAGVLCFLLAPLHSLLGERRIFRQLMRQKFPPIKGSEELTKQVLRYFWHLVGVLWWGFAAMLWRWATLPSLAPTSRWSAGVIVGVFLASSAGSLVATRGRHVSWWLFLLVAVVVGLGLR